MSSEPINAWITKYALTKGIYQEHCVTCPDIDDKMISSNVIPCVCYFKPHWHLTEREAVKRANIMVAKAITACERQLAILREMRFTVGNNEVPEKGDER